MIESIEQKKIAKERTDKLWSRESVNTEDNYEIVPKRRGDVIICDVSQRSTRVN